MIPLLTLLLPVLSSVIGKVIPDAGAAQTAQLELQKALIEQSHELDKALLEASRQQNEVNLAEAQNPSRFVSGWRPFVGWICGFGCAYTFLAQPFLVWGTGIVNALAGSAMPVPPSLDMATLYGLLGGLLGLGTLRTVERNKGSARIK
jgi:hypothetical protein